jgi:hypothetical protein
MTIQTTAQNPLIAIALTLIPSCPERDVFDLEDWAPAEAQPV